MTYDESFEWDLAKAETNYRKHKVRFEHATLAFGDIYALIEQDMSEDYGEDRFVLIGRCLNRILTVIYTERGECWRIISAREANDYERRNYYRAAQEE
jgi:uncharacterized DUF497 family protein